MDVKLLVGQDFPDRLKAANQGDKITGLSSLTRYETFRDTFGKDNFGVVLAGDLQSELRGGYSALTYAFDDDLNLIPEEEGVQSRLFIPSSFKTDPSREEGIGEIGEVREIMDYLQQNRLDGNISSLCNSVRGTLSEDKLTYKYLVQRGFPLIETFHFENYPAFRDFVDIYKGKYVIKPRIGEQGLGIKQINAQNMEDFKELNFSDFIIQEKADIEDEVRLIFFDGEFLGSRKVLGRQMPWETGTSREQCVHYTPSDDEINNSRKILKTLDLTWGCVDWVSIGGQSERKFLEVNGPGTNLKIESGAYDLNQAVATRLKDKFLN